MAQIIDFNNRNKINGGDSGGNGVSVEKNLRQGLLYDVSESIQSFGYGAIPVSDSVGDTVDILYPCMRRLLDYTGLGMARLYVKKIPIEEVLVAFNDNETSSTRDYFARYHAEKLKKGFEIEVRREKDLDEIVGLAKKLNKKFNKHITVKMMEYQ